MTEQEKELLLKDLCARLPYGVKVAIDYKAYLNLLPDDTEDSHYKENFNFLLKYEKKTIEEKSLEPQIINSYPCGERFGTFRGCHEDYGVPVELIKPYLRPMSSMTEEEVKEFAALESIDVIGGDTKITCVELSIDAIDWLNKKMFDYRGLIEKGLALEAPKDMYN